VRETLKDAKARNAPKCWWVGVQVTKQTFPHRSPNGKRRRTEWVHRTRKKIKKKVHRHVIIHARGVGQFAKENRLSRHEN